MHDHSNEQINKQTSGHLLDTTEHRKERQFSKHMKSDGPAPACNAHDALEWPFSHTHNGGDPMVLPTRDLLIHTLTERNDFRWLEATTPNNKCVTKQMNPTPKEWMHMTTTAHDHHLPKWKAHHHLLHKHMSKHPTTKHMDGKSTEWHTNISRTWVNDQLQNTWWTENQLNDPTNISGTWTTECMISNYTNFSLPSWHHGTKEGAPVLPILTIVPILLIEWSWLAHNSHNALERQSPNTCKGGSDGPPYPWPTDKW